MHYVNEEDQRLMVDPPSGWMYGFPKPYFKAAITNQLELNTWLVNNGYPQQQIDNLGEQMHVRYWSERL